jgi:hypothetical protein
VETGRATHRDLGLGLRDRRGGAAQQRHRDERDRDSALHVDDGAEPCFHTRWSAQQTEEPAAKLGTNDNFLIDWYRLEFIREEQTTTS